MSGLPLLGPAFDSRNASDDLTDFEQEADSDDGVALNLLKALSVSPWEKEARDLGRESGHADLIEAFLDGRKNLTQIDHS